MNTIETIDYRGYQINIGHGTAPLNPFEDWDCNPDLIVYSHDRFTSYGDTDIYDLPELTRDEIRKNVDTIKRLTECKTLLRLTTDYASSYRYLYDNATEMVNDAIAECFWAQSNSDKLDFMEAILTIKGIVCLNGCATGYTQDHHAKVLAIASREFIARTGATFDKPEDLQYTIDLYGYWASGNVYGFTVDDINSECIDSCFGFFGPDFEENGLLESARNAIDCHIAQAEKERIRELKVYIKNRVPLHYRAKLASECSLANEYGFLESGKIYPV